MKNQTITQVFTPKLSRMRTFLFGALAFVWFGEMVQWGFLASSGGWQNVWKYFPSEAPELATVLLITHAIRAASKGALGIMALFGLRSRNPLTRTVLFVSMALVPPLNILFPCRADGFPFGTTSVAVVFSIILWVSFFLFKEPVGQTDLNEAREFPKPSFFRWELIQYSWFAVSSGVLTLMSALFLAAPRTALDFIFPGLAELLHKYDAGLSSMISSNLSSGTHLLALALASWIATVFYSRYPGLRQAMTAASIVHAGLLCLLPLRRIIFEIGGSSATNSVLVAFIPLLVGWALYAAFSFRAKAKNRLEAFI